MELAQVSSLKEPKTFEYLFMTQLVTSNPKSDLSRVDTFPLDSDIKVRVLSSGKTLCAPNTEALLHVLVKVH
jgi:hypothetical protein